MLLGLPSRLGNVGLGLGLGLYNPYAAAQEQSAFLTQDQSAFYAAAVSVFFFKPTKNFTKKKIRSKNDPVFFCVWFGLVGLGCCCCCFLVFCTILSTSFRSGLQIVNRLLSDFNFTFIKKETKSEILRRG